MLTPEIKSVIDKWNTNFSLPRINHPTSKIINSIQLALTIEFFREEWKACYSKLVRSEFLMKKKRGPKPDIFWFTDMDNFNSLFNGKYDNAPTTTHDDRQEI